MRLVTGIMAVFMVSALLLPVMASVGAGPETQSREDVAYLPRWAPLDEWTYRTIIENEDRYIPGSGTIHIAWFSDNSTYVTATQTEDCGSDVCYRLDFTGNSVMIGDVDGTAYTQSDSNSGHYLYRVMDLAFVEGDVDSTSQISMSGIDMTCTLNSVITTNTPLTQFDFPMTFGKTWDVKSKISQTVTGSCTTPFGPMPVNDNSWTEYDYTATVQSGTVEHTVPAGTFTCLDIHELGTINRKGEVSSLDQSNFFTSAVKRHINLTQEGEMLKAYDVNFYPDLEVWDENITVDPATPSQDAPATINVTIWNKGDEDATDVKVKFSDGTTEITTETVATLTADAYANLSVDWTPQDHGTRTIKVELDPLSAITEYFEFNNIASIEVEVSEPMPDLRIEPADIGVPSETPIDKAVTIEATVHNIGSLDADAVTVRFFDGADTIGDDQVYDTIPLGSSVTPSVVWTPTDLGSHTIKVQVDPAGTITELSESNNLALKVVEVVQLNYSFTMTVPISSKEIGPNETAEYQVNIQNTGKKQDTVDLVVSPPPEHWTASMDKSSLSLAPGSGQPVVVSVHSPLGAPAGTVINLTVQATSQGDPVYKQSAFLSTTVEQVARVSPQLKTDAEDLEGAPGETVTYDFTIENQGNAADTFSLSVDTQKSWTTTLGDPSTGPLAPGGRLTVSVETTIPSTALAGDTDAITLTARSDFDPTHQQEVTVVVTALQVFDLDVSVTPPTVDVEPDNTVTFTAKVTNDGNGDDLINISLSAVPELPADWVVTLDDSVNVKAGKDKDVVFTINVPEGAAVEGYTLTFEAVGGDSGSKTTLFSLNILQVYDLEVDILPTTAQVKAGKTVMYTVTVTNKGNGDDTAELSVNGLSPKLIATFSQDEVALAPGGSEDITLIIKAKSSAKGTSSFDVVAESKDGDASDSASTSLSVKVEQQTDDLNTTFLLIGVVVAGVVGVALVIMYKRSRGG